MSTNQQSIHWLAVGKISDLASREVVRTGGQVVYLASEPTITLVGIAHDANAHPDDLAFYHASQIQIDVHSTGLAVVWVSSDRIINAAYSSLTETELITYSEYEAQCYVRCHEVQSRKHEKRLLPKILVLSCC